MKHLNREIAMFLDEKLEKIYSENSDRGKRAIELITTCVESLDKTNVTTYLDSLNALIILGNFFVRSTKNMTLMALETMFLNVQAIRPISIKKHSAGKSMKKRIVNKYFSQIKKSRKNVRLKRKIGRKEMTYLYEHRKDIFPGSIWDKLLKTVIDWKGLSLNICKQLKRE